LFNSFFSAALPALLAAAMLQKKIGDDPIGFDLPAR
jgi:hypothetical protein